MEQLELSKRISAWKQSPFDAATRAAVKTLEKDPKAAEDAFYTDLSFGTGGMARYYGRWYQQSRPTPLAEQPKALPINLNEVSKHKHSGGHCLRLQK